MKYSIVSIVKDDPKGIILTVESVKRQTYHNFEHIIINGSASPETSIALSQISYKNTKIYQGQDKGIYDAMNKGIFHSLGQFVIFINAGDEFYSDNTMLELDKYVESENEIYIGSYNLIRNRRARIFKPSIKNYNYSLPFNHQSCITPTSILKQYQFDDSLKILGDLKLYRHLYSLNFKFKIIPVTIANFYSGGISSIPSKLYLDELKRLDFNNPKSPSFVYFKFKYIIKLILHKLFS